MCGKGFTHKNRHKNKVYRGGLNRTAPWSQLAESMARPQEKAQRATLCAVKFVHFSWTNFGSCEVLGNNSAFILAVSACDNGSHGKRRESSHHAIRHCLMSLILIGKV